MRVHERCDTAVEYIVTDQWFIRHADFKEEFLAAGDQVAWRPAAYDSALPAMGRESKLGLGHLAPALFRRAFSGVVL